MLSILNNIIIAGKKALFFFGGLGAGRKLSFQAILFIYQYSLKITCFTLIVLAVGLGMAYTECSYAFKAPLLVPVEKVRNDCLNCAVYKYLSKF